MICAELGVNELLLDFGLQFGGFFPISVLGCANLGSKSINACIMAHFFTLTATEIHLQCSNIA